MTADAEHEALAEAVLMRADSPMRRATVAQRLRVGPGVEVEIDDGPSAGVGCPLPGPATFTVTKSNATDATWARGIFFTLSPAEQVVAPLVPLIETVPDPVRCLASPLMC
jgi:hypothetical protein